MHEIKCKLEQLGWHSDKVRLGYSASHSLCSTFEYKVTRYKACLSAVWPSIKLGCWYICYGGSTTVRSLVCITTAVQQENIDHLQMLIKYPTYREQTRKQEVDISAPFTLRELYLSTLMVRTQRSTVFSTQLHRMQTLTLALRK